MIKNNDELVEQLGQEKLLPLYTVNNLDYLDKLEEILLNNSLNFIEVTYRSDLASQAIKQLADSEKLIVGAGTVRTLEVAKEAVENGAQFIVTPGLSEDVLEYCQENDILCFPGVATPSEIIKAMEYDISVVKFFPAKIYGGLDAIKALSGPFFDVKFVPTGGVNASNFEEYLDNDSILAVGGSFIISEEAITKDNGAAANQTLNDITSKIQ